MVKLYRNGKISLCLNKTLNHMKVGDIVKIKNSSFPYQENIRYKIVKILKTCLYLEETIDKHIYRNVKKSIVTLA